jgi:selenocysteine-specific elongation factor
MPVVATAGHVDHGKSTLIQALTGRDPDRFAEEKRRGMTIDLGFAWTELPSGQVVSFVDVPGHHSFIRNTLAGLGPVDAALVVVAANEGWMPQTEEHVTVLDLLGVRRAVVAITKIDASNEQAVTELAARIEERLASTSLAGVRLVPVAAVTGEGLGNLRAALDAMVGSPVDLGRPRLWVDRVFTMPGAGVVVTGTLNGGSLTKDQKVEIWPGPMEARIRRLEHNEHEVDHAQPSTRVAINLVGVRQESLVRGAMLCAPGSFRPTRRALLELRPATEAKPSGRGAYQLHIGTLAVPVRLRPLDDPGAKLALADLAREVCLQAGDRVIIRDTGRRRLVAGGTVIDPNPPRRRRDCLGVAESLLQAVAGGPDEIATALLDVRGSELIQVLASDSGGGHPRAALVTDGRAVSAAAARALADRIATTVDAHHRAHPHDPGVGVGQLAAALDITPGMVRDLIPLIGLEVSGQTVALPSAGGTVATNPEWLEVRATMESAGPAPPTISELGLDRDLLATLVRAGHLVRISDDLVYLPGELERLVRLMTGFGGPFTVSELRQAAGVSRRYAIPLLEWTDREGITTRDGDVRTVRRPFGANPGPK